METTATRLRREGRVEGQAQLLTRLLVRRFGELPSACDDHLADASLEEIERWGDRILDATSIEEVFAGE